MPRYRCKQCQIIVEAQSVPRHCFECGSDRRFETVADDPLVESPAAVAPPHADRPATDAEIRLAIRCECGFENSYTEDDRGYEMYCGSCGTAVLVPGTSGRESVKLLHSPPVTADSERIVWAFDPAEAGEDGGAICGCPAIGREEQIYVTSGRSLFALREEEDKPAVLWRASLSDTVCGCPAIGRDGRVRVFTADGRLHLVDSSGEPCGEPVEVGEPLEGSTPVVDADDFTWIGTWSGGLMRVSPSGTASPAADGAAAVTAGSPVLLTPDMAIVLAGNGFLYTLGRAPGSSWNRWEHEVDGSQAGCLVETGPAAVAGPFVVFAGRDERLWAFDLDGGRRWSLPIAGCRPLAPLADDQGRIYAATNALDPQDERPGGLVCIDGLTRVVRWHYRTAAPVRSQLVLGDDGTVYVGDAAGTLHAVGGDGQARWTETLGAAAASPGALRCERVLFGLDNGTLVALRCESGGLAGGWPKFLGTRENSGSGSAGRSESTS